MGAAAGSGPPPRAVAVAEPTIRDGDAYTAYVRAAAPTLAAHGSQVLFATAKLERLEGEREWTRLVSFAFGSLAAAHAWYASPEYQAAIELRRAHVDVSLWFIEQTGEQAEPAVRSPGRPPLAYIHGQVTAIRDAAPFKEYLAGVAPSLAAVGARYLSRGGRIDHVEGAWRPERAVLIEFPSWEAAAAWFASPEYRPLAELRRGCCDTDLVLVEGLPAR